MKQATYKWNATTLEGFVQQLAVAYVARRVLQHSWPAVLEGSR